ncbi:MAG: methyltransferase domain-containing protein [Acidimicrobiales bacterium]
MHPEAFQFLADNTPKSARTVLDVGGRDINGSPRSLFPGAHFTAVDPIDGPGVDVVADITKWADERTFTVVICAEVLEHVKNWQAVVAACFQRVRPGGTLLLTAATDGRDPHSAYDGGPIRPDEHYRNVQGDKLKAALAEVGAVKVDVVSHPGRGDVYAVAHRRAKPRARRERA